MVDWLVVVRYGWFYFGKVSRNLVSKKSHALGPEVQFRFHGTVGQECYHVSLQEVL